MTDKIMTDEQRTEIRDHLMDKMDKLMHDHLIEPALNTLDRRRKAREKRKAKKAAA